MTGRIIEILANDTQTSAVVVVDIFQVTAERHEIFDMPVLVRRYSERESQIICAKVSHIL